MLNMKSSLLKLILALTFKGYFTIDIQFLNEFDAENFSKNSKFVNIIFGCGRLYDTYKKILLIQMYFYSVESSKKEHREFALN